MNKVVWVVLGVIVALVAGGFVVTRGLRYTKRTTSEPANIEQAPTVAESNGVEDTKVELVEISGSEYSFSPSKITLKKGEKTRITFKNVGNAPHNLVIPDLGVSTAVISGGQEVSVEATPAKTGEFMFYCSVGNHKDLGMEGQVVVE